MSEVTAGRQIEEERHASWAELFFDLVAVAGVASLAHVVADEVTPSSLGLYAVLFLAFWLAWTTFMLYGNVAGERTRIVRLLTGMFGLGVMAASVPGVAQLLLGDDHEAGNASGHATAARVFTIAYVAARVFGAQSWRRGQLLLDFPVAQHTAGVLPWVASLWVPDETWKVGLWALGVAVDLVLVLMVSGDEMLQRFQDRVEEERARPRKRGGRRPGPVFSIEGVATDPTHLAERLGLFVIIVLGEGVVQVVDAASGATYSRGLLGAGLISFLLLVGMFGLSVVYGHAGVPHLRPGVLDARRSLVMHVAITAVLATVAVSLAAEVEDGSQPLDDARRWLLCGAVAAYFAVGLVAAGLARGFRARVVAVWVLSGIGAPLLLGALAVDVRGSAVVAYVALVVYAHLWMERRRETATPVPGG